MLFFLCYICNTCLWCQFYQYNCKALKIFTTYVDSKECYLLSRCLLESQNLLREIKVSKSQKHFFLKLHCPKNERNIWQNYALHSFIGQNFVWYFIRFLGNGVSRNIAFEIYWPLVNIFFSFSVSVSFCMFPRRHIWLYFTILNGLTYLEVGVLLEYILDPNSKWKCRNFS